MIFEPHNYQKVAIQKILDNKACGLFLDMGMGKTASTLQAIDELMFDSFDIKKVLVIAPLRVARDTWPDELAKWSSFKTFRLSVVLGKPGVRVKALAANADIYAINRENVVWLVDYYGKKWPFDMVVIDELSSFKNSNSRRFRSLRKVRPLSKRVVGLTGTPSPRGLIDLWAQMYLLDRGERLGKTITGYRQRYFVAGQHSGRVVYEWKSRPETEANIYERIGDICMSMRSTDYLKMPEKIEQVIKVKLSDKARAKYNRMERELLLPCVDEDGNVMAEVVANSAATLSGKLLQMANGAVYDENHDVQLIHNDKLDVLEELIEEANGKPVMVLYWFKHDLARLQARFPYARQMKTHQDQVDWEAKRIPLLLVHPASVGHGLNLQHGGNQIIWFGLTWSLEAFQQTNARLYRQGQTEKTVVITLLVVDHSVDEDALKTLAGRAVTQNALIDAIKARIKDVFK